MSQTLRWKAGDEDDSHRLECVAKSDERLWDDATVEATIKVTEEGAEGKNNGDDEVQWKNGKIWLKVLNQA